MIRPTIPTLADYALWNACLPPDACVCPTSWPEQAGTGAGDTFSGPTSCAAYADFVCPHGVDCSYPPGPARTCRECRRNTEMAVGDLDYARRVRHSVDARNNAHLLLLATLAVGIIVALAFGASAVQFHGWRI